MLELNILLCLHITWTRKKKKRRGWGSGALMFWKPFYLWKLDLALVFFFLILYGYFKSLVYWSVEVLHSHQRVLRDWSVWNIISCFGKAPHNLVEVQETFQVLFNLLLLQLLLSSYNWCGCYLQLNWLLLCTSISVFVFWGSLHPCYICILLFLPRAQGGFVAREVRTHNRFVRC